MTTSKLGVRVWAEDRFDDEIECTGNSTVYGVHRDGFEVPARLILESNFKDALEDAFRCGLLTEGTKADSEVVWRKYLKEKGIE